MDAGLALRRTLLTLTGALDAASAELDRLAWLATDDPKAVEQAAAAVVRSLAAMMNREAANVTAQRHL